MRIVQSVTILLLILLGAATLIIPVTPNTAPRYPDIANVVSAKSHHDSRWNNNMPGAGVIVCLLSAATPKDIDTPSERICPYQTDTQPCPYQWNR